MSKRVILRIDQGNFEQGFRVSLEIRDHQRNLLAGEVFGTLVPNSKIPDLYQEWQKAYYAWGQDENCRWCRRKIDIPPSMNQNYSSSEDSVNRVENAAETFKTAFNNWLSSSLLEDIKWALSQNVKTDEPVTFIVKTDNPELQKLPWDIWSISERYRHFQVALSKKIEPIKGGMSFPVKILVILGSDENIDIETDWQILQNTLQPGAKLTPLKQPTVAALKEKLRSQPWDIVFFAGHSATNPDVNDARIWLDDQTSLSPQNIKRELQKAVENGLKLAIFNSCDGLGLARQLDNLDIPHIIVMREPVHDQVAQKFLEHFLTSFAKGESLHRAVCEARENLKDEVEDYSPNASWLPVIFQNPEEPPLTYPRSEPPVTIIQDPQPKPSENRGKTQQLAWWGLGAIALISLAFAIDKIIELDKDSTRVSGISLGEEILSQYSTPEKEAGVKAFENKNYRVAIAKFKASLDQNPNDPEAKIYLFNAKAAANSKETIKIAVSVPLGGNQSVAEEILRGVALVQQDLNRDDGINGKPLQVVIANDNNNRDLAQNVARKFVKDTAILAVVGHNASNATVAAVPIYTDGKLVMISPTSWSNDFTNKHKSYIFRMMPQITFFAAQLSHSIGKEVSKPNIAICLDISSDDNQSFRREFQFVLSAYKGHHIDLPCNLADPNFDPNIVVDLIKRNKVNSLLVAPHVNNIPKGIAIFKAVREHGLSIKLFGSPTLYTEQTIKLGGEAVEGLTISAPYFPDAKQKDEFRSLWKAELNTWRTTMASDATRAIATALQQLLLDQNPTRDKL
ncbi:MAG TPA: ABC transporter substrate-binding protein, partial [Cyanobacteria bacterium UBA11367]|nr:ABC transporter substrate-binding protein [Cyanobacteria bacterium UBA11367]